jgi:hypothetical protein
MIQQREDSRRALRLRRAHERSKEAACAIQVLERASDVLDRMRQALAQPNCAILLQSYGVAALPAFMTIEDGSSATGRNSVLEFAVAWRFLYPLLGRPGFAADFDAAFPGLVAQMKDTFILIVCEGAFPAELSGHVGRQHKAAHHTSKLRINRHVGNTAVLYDDVTTVDGKA